MGCHAKSDSVTVLLAFAVEKARRHSWADSGSSRQESIKSRAAAITVVGSCGRNSPHNPQGRALSTVSHVVSLHNTYYTYYCAVLANSLIPFPCHVSMGARTQAPWRQLAHQSAATLRAEMRFATRIPGLDFLRISVFERQTDRCGAPAPHVTSQVRQLRTSRQPSC